MTTPKAKPKKSGRAAWMMGVFLLLVVIALAARFGDGKEFGALIRRARPAWLFAALALQVGTYFCAAGVWHRALARQGHRLPMPSLVPLGVAKVFMDFAVPSAGLSGNLMATRGLQRRGFSHRDAMAAMLGGLIAFYIAYGLAVAGGVTILWFSGHVSPYIVTAATVFAVIVGAIPAGILRMTRRGRKPGVPKWARRIGPLKRFLITLKNVPTSVMRSPRFLAEATALQLGLIVLDAATLGVAVLAVGSTPDPFGVFAAFTMASMVATVSPIPGGLGTFDGTAIALLHAFGIALEPALAATVLLRGFMLLLPLLPGFWLARVETKRRG